MNNKSFPVFGILVIVGLPGILLIDNPSLIKYSSLYLIFMSPFMIFTIWAFKTQSFPLKNYGYRILSMSTFAIPITIIAAYPFSIGSILFALALASIGFGIPFVSKYLTWWFYTLGGLGPLPKEHNWLLSETKSTKYKGLDYKHFVEAASGIAVSIGLVLSFFYQQRPPSEVIFFMKLIFSLVIFGITLTFGTALRKKQLIKR